MRKEWRSRSAISCSDTSRVRGHLQSPRIGSFEILNVRAHRLLGAGCSIWTSLPHRWADKNKSLFVLRLTCNTTLGAECCLCCASTMATVADHQEARTITRLVRTSTASSSFGSLQKSPEHNTRYFGSVLFFLPNWRVRMLSRPRAFIHYVQFGQLRPIDGSMVLPCYGASISYTSYKIRHCKHVFLSDGMIIKKNCFLFLVVFILLFLFHFFVFVYVIKYVNKRLFTFILLTIADLLFTFNQTLIFCFVCFKYLWVYFWDGISIFLWYDLTDCFPHLSFVSYVNPD